MASLIGSGPRQYLLAWEDGQSFDDLKSAFDETLRPVDAIERMWADEIVDLEWDLHRLRRTRRTIVENSLVERLTDKVAMMNAATVSLTDAPRVGEQFAVERATLAAIRYQARKCVQGDPAGHQYIYDRLMVLDMAHEVLSVQAENTEVLARLEYSIHATSRLRDAVLARFYSRRDLIADGRVVPGRSR